MTERRQVLMLGSCVLIALVALLDGVTSAAEKPLRRSVVIPAKTALDIRLATVVTPESNRRAEDPVLASLATPVIVDGVSVAPAASVLLGNVVVTNQSATSDAPQEMALQFDRLRVGPITYDIRTAPVRIAGDAQRAADDSVRVGSGTRLRLELLEPVTIQVQRLR